MNASFASLLRTLICLFLVTFTASVARAERAESAAPRPLDDRDIGVWDHFEMSMGFLAERRTYRDATFAYSGSATPLPGTTALVEPFQRAPFRDTNLYGLRYEVRLVAAYVRMNAGVDFPFASYRAADATGDYNVGGTTQHVSARSLSVGDLHFGIGFEYPIGPVAPYVDLLGGLRWTTTDLSIGGVSQEYSTREFGLGARGGVRVHVRRWLFVAASGEVGLVGGLRYGADLSVGFAFGKF